MIVDCSQRGFPVAIFDGNSKLGVIVDGTTTESKQTEHGHQRAV
jgi:hypothetical protein